MSDIPRDNVRDDEPTEQVPVGEWKWTEDYSYSRKLTCKNHPTAVYYTKNPWARNLHLIQRPVGDIPRSPTGECVCPFSDLVVLVRPEVKNA